MSNDQPEPRRPDPADKDQPAEGGDIPEAGRGAEHADSGGQRRAEDPDAETSPAVDTSPNLDRGPR